jgi:fibronectin-binding autotransporter adhesin
MKIRALLLTFVTAPSAVMAVDYTFNGGVADWNTAASWTPATVPSGGGGNFAYINSGTATITADTPAIQDPFIGRGAGTNGTVNQSAGNHTNAGWTFIGTDGGTGAWNVTGTASMTTGRIYVGGQREFNGGTGSMIINTSGTVTAGSDFSVGSRGATGSVNMSAGQLNANSWMIIGESVAGVGGTTGTFTQSGGAVNAGVTDANARLWLGSNENGAAVAGTKGEYFLNGGTLDANNILVGKDYVGTFTQAAGTTFTIRGTGADTQIAGNAGAAGSIYTMNGGTLNAGGNFQIGAGAQGSFVQSGGTANFSAFPVVGRFVAGNGQATISGGSFNQTNTTARLIIGEEGTGTLTVSGTGTVNSSGGISLGHLATGNGTLDLNAGGTVATPFLGKTGGTAQFNFNGGVLKATADQAQYLSVLDGTTFNPSATALSSAEVEILAGGLTVDSNGFSIGISAALDGVGGLTKTGAGTLTLSGANTYVGLTTISSGTLAVIGSVSGSVSISNGATLAGNGTVGSVTVAEGATLAPGTSPGTLNVGNLGLLSSTTLAYELDTPGIVGSNVNDLISVTGDLTLDGTLQITPLAGFGNGSYRIFDYTGSLTNNGLSLQPGFLASYPGSAIDTSIANQVNLTVVPEPTAAVSALAGLGLLFGTRRRRSA